MELLYFLEGIRNPVCDFFFSAITHLGEETLFLVIAILMFWCVDKRRGYYVLITGFFGTIINQLMKLWLKIPRPWVKDPNFTVVGDAKVEATGYSFPSGHSQTAVGTFGGIAVTSKRNWVKIICIAIAILVPVSRMYLGVHTPWDVLAGSGCAILLLLLLEPLFFNEKLHEKAMPFIVGAVFLASVAFFLYAVVFTPASEDENVISAAHNACTLLGCSFGLILVYILDTYLVKFETEAPWYCQIIKLGVGLGIVLLIKAVLKSPLLALMGDNYERIVRYFLIVAFAGGVWPMTFGFFAKLRIPVLDRFGEWVASLFKGKAKDKSAQ